MEIGGFEIENSTCEKLLEVHFDSRLNLDYHISVKRECTKQESVNTWTYQKEIS